jgi:hypothetical protein
MSYFILLNIQQIKKMFETLVTGLHKHIYCHIFCMSNFLFKFINSVLSRENADGKFKYVPLQLLLLWSVIT